MLQKIENVNKQTKLSTLEKKFEKENFYKFREIVSGETREKNGFPREL